jgi:hypothetical protein
MAFNPGFVEILPPNKIIRRPVWCYVADALLRDPPIRKSDDMSTERFNNLLIVLNCGQQVVGDKWKKDPKKRKRYWKKQPGVEFVMQWDLLCLWCGHSDKIMRRQLDRFEQPIGERPAPLLCYRVHRSLRMKEPAIYVCCRTEWVHIQEYYSPIYLPVPRGDKKQCRTYCASSIRKYEQWARNTKENYYDRD